MNLPALQRIAMEFEKENDVMDQRQEMMDDAIDDVTGVEDEEEGEEVVKEVLDEIGVDLGQAVCVDCVSCLWLLEMQAVIDEHFELTICVNSWARRLLGSRRLLLQMGELRKPLEDLRAEGVVQQATMTCKLAWTAYDDKISPTCVLIMDDLAGQIQ